jgi:ferritin-like metal-binding protein YciE
VWQPNFAALPPLTLATAGDYPGLLREKTMSAPSSLKEVYVDEMKDLWSANDQMTKAIKTMAEHVGDKKLKQMLEQSVSGIQEHVDTLKSLIEEAGGEVSKEHCKGMAGLVKEAHKHIIEEAPEDEELKAVVAIAQYQRMSHYGLAGFGSAASYASTLGMKDAATKLKDIVKSIYQADEYSSQLGERTAKLAEKHAKKAA